MKTNNFSKRTVKIISVALAIFIALSVFVMPVSIFADVSYSEPTNLSDGLLVNPDVNTVYVGSSQLVNGEKIKTDASNIELQREQRVAGWNWSIYDDGGNSVIRALKHDWMTYGTAGALRVNYDGNFCILKPAQAYYLSFKYKVVSAHVTFEKSGITYPLDTTISTFKVGYGSNVSTYFNNGNGMPNVTTPIATVAELTNNTTQYNSYNEYGEMSVKNVGEWYTAEYYFSTPETMDYVPYLAFSTGFYNGCEILLDDIYIKETPTVNLVTNGGSGINVKHPAVVGSAVNFPIPVREGYTFAGWYKDLYCTTAFTDTVFTEENSNGTLYAKWEKELNTQIADFYDYETGSSSDGTYRENVVLNQNNTKNASINTVGDAYSTKVLTFSNLSQINNTNRAYIPLGNLNSNITVKSNTTYSLLIDKNYSLSNSGSDFFVKLFAANSENPEGTETAITEIQMYTTTSEREYFTFTTPEIPKGNDSLYFEISKSNGKNNSMTFNKVKIIEISSDVNYIRAYDKLNNAVYEHIGHCGDSVSLEALEDTANYSFDGWYLSEDFAERHNGVHKNEGITYIYALWQNKVVDFEDFKPALSDSYHTIGDDIVIGQSTDSYGGKYCLTYSYNYAPNYFGGSHNAASLAVVYDKTPYKITFKYKLNTSLSDVELKFFTAHRSNRWTYLTNYDEATYTIYSTEAGKGWKEATVYLTTNFVKAEHSDGLFMSFNPVTEGETVVCIDDFKVEMVKAGEGVIAYLGKGDKAYTYQRAAVGTNATAITTQPGEYFSSFGGWYADKECTVAFKGTTVQKGITYVYSKWTENKENFEGYLYSNRKVVTDNGNKVLKNGSAILGAVEDNSTYLVTYKYKTSDSSSSVYFETAPKTYESAFSVKYSEEGSILKGEQLIADNAWHTAKRYISTSFFNEDADILYAVANGAIAVDDIVLKKIDVLIEKGASALTKDAEETADSQALRFYYSYVSDNGATITVDGEELTLVERGIVLKNATADEGALTVENAETAQKGYAVKSKTYGFGSYWNYDSENGSVVYSYYLTDLYKDDARDISARGYIKVKDNNGTVYTIYSSKNNTNVKDVKAVAAEVTDKKVHTISGKNWNRFTIINSRVIPYIYGMQIENLIDYAAGKGVTLTRANDKANITPVRPYEIIVGDTMREESLAVTLNGENEWVIAVKGSKLVIKGGSDIATAQGVIEFINYLKRKDELECGADLYDGFELRGEYAPASNKYSLTFNDDFDTFDTSVWGVYAGLGQGYKYEDSKLGGTTTIRGYGNDPVLTMSGEEKELVRVEDGNLILATAYGTPTYQKDIDMNVQFFNSNVSTFGRMIYQYGMLEIREKVASVPACTSLWINGDGTFNGEKRGCMTEYDLNENYGRTNHVESCIHHWSNNHTTNKLEHFGPDYNDYTGDLLTNFKPEFDETDIYADYHIYTFVWEEDKIIFALDGVKYCEYDIPDWYQEKACNNLILSCGMGARNYGASYDPSRHSDYLESHIDYVKIYQVEDMGSKLYFK